MENNIIKLTEQDFRKIIKESVNRIIKEGYSNYVKIYDKMQLIKQYLGADELADRMTYFLYSKGLFDGFLDYLYNTGQMADYDGPDFDDDE